MNWSWIFRAVWMLCLGVNDMSREMKDSGVEWIGEIPKDWHVLAVKHYFDIGRGRVISAFDLVADGKYPVYSSQTDQNGCFGYLDTYDYSGPAITWTTDGAKAGTVFYRDGYYNCTNVCGILQIKPQYKKNSELRFLTRAIGIVAECNKRADINGYKIMSNEMANIHFAIPSFKEQIRIADFLDKKCDAVDELIKQTRESIGEYKRYKSTLLTHVVTHGICTDSVMKNSGVDWMEKVPENWKVTQLRHCASIRSGITLGKTYSKDTELVKMPYLRVANVQDGYVDTNDVAVLQVSKEEIEKYNLSAGEVLMTEGGDRDKLGRGCVWDGRITPCLHQNHIFAVKVKENLLNPYYLEYLTASSVGRTYFDVTAVKTTNLACTSSSKVLAFTIPLPSIEEQNEIVDYLKEKCGCIETVISKKEQFISELENYKKSLIYEYVTGKKEVPES